MNPLPTPPPPPCVNLCSTCGPPNPLGGPSRSSTHSVSWSTTAPSPVAPAPVQIARSGTSKAVGRSWSPRVGSPRCHNVTQADPDLMALRLMAKIRNTSSPGGLGAANQPHLPVANKRPGGCLPRGRGQLDPTHHLLGQLRPLGPDPRGPLGVEHGQLR